MKRIKKLSAIICAFAIVLSACSCAKGEGESEFTDIPAVSDTESAQTTEKDYIFVENDFSNEVRSHLSKIQTRDYEGAVFQIATPMTPLFNVDECSVGMRDAVADRNYLVENKFNISVVGKNYDSDTLYGMAYKANLAGDYFADLVMIPQYYISQYVTSGMLFNLNSLPFSNFSAGYNIPSGVSAAMGASNGYAVAGWASLDCDTLPCVFFNQDAIEKAGLELPYDLVRRGEWTWDKFFEYTAATTDINGELGGNMYSWGTQNSSLNMADIVYVSEGNSFISGGLGNPVSVTMTYEGSLHAVQNGQKLYSEPLKNTDSMNTIDTFAKGGSLFLIDRMGTMKGIASSETVWGVLPMPKGTPEQEKYYSLAPNDSLFFGALSSIKNAEVVSLVLSSLNAASMGNMVDAYVNNSMYYYLRNNDSVEMVEKVCYGVTYDMAYSFGNSNLAISNGTYFGLRNVYEMNHDMNFYINRFQGGANNALYRLFPQ